MNGDEMADGYVHCAMALVRQTFPEMRLKTEG